LLNGVAGVIRCLGYPIPSIPDSVMEKAKEAVGNLSKKSSVEEFDVLQVQSRAKALGPKNRSHTLLSLVSLCDRIPSQER
jgi:hypothetical protein